MSLTSYKPLFVYGVILAVLGIAATAFQSIELIHACVVAYIVGWTVFLINIGKGR